MVTIEIQRYTLLKVELFNCCIKVTALLGYLDLDTFILISSGRIKGSGNF